MHVLGSLRKKQYSQAEMDHLCKSLVLTNFTYCLSVYGGSESDLNIIQPFLDRCHKHRFFSVWDFLHRQHCKILKAITSVDNHLLGSNLPQTKENIYGLRKNSVPFSRLIPNDLWHLMQIIRLNHKIYNVVYTYYYIVSL